MNSDNSLGRHEASPHLLINRREAITMDEQEVNHLLLLSACRQVSEILSAAVALLLNKSVVDTFLATANHQKASTLGVAKPNHLSRQEDLG